MGLKEFLHQQKEKYKGKPIAPAFNALHTFLYVPNETTKNGAHIRDASDLKRVMFTVVIALLPAFFFGVYNIGYQYYDKLGALSQSTFFDKICVGMEKMLPMLIVTYGVGLLIEFIFAIIRKHEVNEGFLVTGMLVPLILPVDIPLWMLAMGVAFGVIIGKEVFGGTGMNVLNPALTIRAFLFFAFPKQLTGQIWVHRSQELDAVSGETILGLLSTGKEVDYTPAEMFYGLIPGAVGETSVVAILIGAAILLYTGVGSWRIMLSCVTGGALMAFIFNLIGGEPLFDFEWYKHLMVGGFLFGTVFMATDPVTAAHTTKGKWIYGFLIGMLCMLIREFNPGYPEGMMLAILLMNVFAPTIDYFVVQANKRRRLARIKAVA